MMTGETVHTAALRMGDLKLLARRAVPACLAGAAQQLAARGRAAGRVGVVSADGRRRRALRRFPRRETAPPTATLNPPPPPACLSISPVARRLNAPYATYLFNVTADPTESVDLAPSRPGDVALLRAPDALNATRAPARTARRRRRSTRRGRHAPETQFITPWLDAGYECDTAGSGSSTGDVGRGDAARLREPPPAAPAVTARRQQQRIGRAAAPRARGAGGGSVSCVAPRPSCLCNYGRVRARGGRVACPD